MKVLKVIVGIIVALVVLFFVVGAFLPKTYTVSRSIVINAPDSIIYKNIADFRLFKTWNPWYKMDPSAKTEISGPVAQPGHVYAWEGKETGQGQMLITSAQPAKLVNIELKFIKPFEGTANTHFSLEGTDEGTKVDWVIFGENKSALDKWMGLSMDKMMGKDFESGLKDLKALSEKK